MAATGRAAAKAKTCRLHFGIEEEAERSVVVSARAVGTADIKTCRR